MDALKSLMHCFEIWKDFVQTQVTLDYSKRYLAGWCADNFRHLCKLTMVVTVA